MRLLFSRFFSPRSVRRVAAASAGLWLSTVPAYAQLDPTLFLKRSQPNVILLVDTASRMERDAPTDPTNTQATSNYYDPAIYARTGAAWESTLGVTALNTTSTYRRRYGFAADGSCPAGGTTCGLTFANGGTTDKFNAGTIVSTTDQSAAYATFLAPTRLAIARAALYQAVKQNGTVARFGLLKMRQLAAKMPALTGNSGPVYDSNPLQVAPTDSGAINGRWNITRPTVAGDNGTALANTALLIQADSATANADVLTILSKAPTDLPSGALSPLIPAGNDSGNETDTPVKYMLDDGWSEASRLINIDLGNGANGQQCRNTVVVLVVGGAEGNSAGNPDPTVTAASYLTTIAGRRVPIYVVAIAPPAADRTQLQNIASKSGGQYFEITKAQIDRALAANMWSAAVTGAPAGTVVVPEAVNAINIGVQAAFENFDDLNNAALAPWPPAPGVPSIIPASEFQVTTPVIGTVNLAGGKDANGNALTPDPATVLDRAGVVIPQRSNLMVTAAFALPGFDGRIRAFRMYKPVADSTQPSGWKFVSDGTPLWSACAPGTTTTGPCASLPNAARNLYTTDANGNMIAFTAGNAGTLAALMGLTGGSAVTDATSVINVVRGLPFGTILDSTPAIMNPPSLDPPPDDAYPGFAVANKNRRSLVFVGTNRGIFEAVDARLGVEVWGYIPLNLLPKLRTLWDGQAVGSTDFMMDGSPKISDIKQADGTWHTYLFLSQGAGGNFYQGLDVTLPNMAVTVLPTDDNITDVLGFFSTASVIPVKWSFPVLSDFEPNCNNLGAGVCATSPWGDIKGSAPVIEKTVGQTWSDPAIGQIQSSVSPYVMLAGSGYMPYSVQQQANRGGTVGGTTFYLFNAETGLLLDSRDVGSDGLYETQDNCAGVNIAPTPSYDCTKFKNALHSDAVATGPADSRFITKAYIGDLDGKIWRFDTGLDTNNKPIFIAGTNPTKLYDDALKQPIFASMATVNVGGSQQYIFVGTGSDLLPSNGVSEQYRLLGVLDNGATGTKTFEIDLAKDTVAGGEKVTTFPAVAGDIVFFTTNSFNSAAPCTLPTANLYALTFIGGPAYDTNNDGKFDSKDSVLVKSIAGVRATAPFIVDQHLVFGGGNKVQVFGDSTDYNNGVGQAGVRILSWREQR